MMARSEGLISEVDLQAWIDGRLTVDRKLLVDRWLTAHPEAAERVVGDRQMRETLRAGLAPKLAEPIPGRLRVATIVARRRKKRRDAFTQIAAAVTLLAGGGVVGWIAHDRASGRVADRRGPSDAAITADAVAAHRLYVAEPRHPVEVVAGDEAHLVRWLSNRLGRPLPTPDLAAQGFRLMGGRLLPGTAAGPAAQLMYVDAAGTRLTVYLRAADEGSDPEFRFAQDGDVNAFWWTDRGFAYAITAAIDRPKLLEVAESVFRALDRPAS